MKDEEYLSLFNYRENAVKISIKPHPEDILDVDPEIIESMKARLKGIDNSKIYDISDRIVDEISLKREKNKLRSIFRSLDQLKEAFSSVKNIRMVYEEMAFEKVNRHLLFNYSHIQSGEENIDEMDFYQFLLFDSKLITKNERVWQYDAQTGTENVFTNILDEYRQFHFNSVKIEREAIQIDSRLKQLFKERKLIPAFNNFLSQFYGMKV